MPRGARGGGGGEGSGGSGLPVSEADCQVRALQAGVRGWQAGVRGWWGGRPLPPTTYPPHLHAAGPYPAWATRDRYACASAAAAAGPRGEGGGGRGGRQGAPSGRGLVLRRGGVLGRGGSGGQRGARGNRRAVAPCRRGHKAVRAADNVGVPIVHSGGGGRRRTLQRLGLPRPPLCRLIDRQCKLRRGGAMAGGTGGHRRTTLCHHPPWQPPANRGLRSPPAAARGPRRARAGRRRRGRPRRRGGRPLRRGPMGGEDTRQAPSPLLPQARLASPAPPGRDRRVRARARRGRRPAARAAPGARQRRPRQPRPHRRPLPPAWHLGRACERRRGRRCPRATRRAAPSALRHPARAARLPVPVQRRGRPEEEGLWQGRGSVSPHRSLPRCRTSSHRTWSASASAATASARAAAVATNGGCEPRVLA